MKIIVFNGSPKGDKSITMQSVFYIEKKFPQYELKIIDLAKDIDKIQNEEQKFQQIIDDVKNSEGVIWAFPLRVLLVPAQVKRFVELIFERNSEAAFRGKYAAVISSSFHGADHLALNYLNAICEDLGMNYTGFYSGELEYLLKVDERERLILFAESYFWFLENKRPASRSFMPVIKSEFKYLPVTIKGNIDIRGKKITIIVDKRDEQSNVYWMVEKFRQLFHEAPEVVELSSLDIRWCKGCMVCAYDNSCKYANSDDFYDFFENSIKDADILMFAGAVTDRFLSSQWKLFFDRSFYNNHIPYLTNKQLGFIISGPLQQTPNIRQYLEMYAEWQQANLVDIVTDEDENTEVIGELLLSLAERTVSFAENKYVRTPTFLSIGLNKIIRDFVWGKMRSLSQANHRYFKKSGFYDFPQGDYMIRIINIVMMCLMRMPIFRKKVYKSAMRLIIMPHQKLIAKLSKNKLEST